MAEGEKKFPILLIVGIVVVALALAGGISYFIAMRIVGEKPGEKQQVVKREPGTFVAVGDAKDGLIINVGGTGSGRYLKIGVILELKPDKNAKPKEGKNLTPEEIKIQDTVVYVLRSMKLEDFAPHKQEQLKELIKNEVNKALGDEKVYDVYITHFVLQ